LAGTKVLAVRFMFSKGFATRVLGGPDSVLATASYLVLEAESAGLGILVVFVDEAPI
jgi:hypothetical protein